MRILLAQINPIVGDLEGNSKKILSAINRGKNNHVDLVLFPELALSGYPPDDFLLLKHFMQAIEVQLEKIIQETSGIAVILGAPRRTSKGGVANSAFVIQDGKLIGYQDKKLLPTYDIFDETRYFDPSQKREIWHIKGKKIAITICEDLLHRFENVETTKYEQIPLDEIENQKPDLLLNLSASPYHVGKQGKRLKILTDAAKQLSCPLLFCNQVGGNDSLIFAGYSAHINASGEAVQLGKAFEEGDLFVDLNQHYQPVDTHTDILEELFQALVLGVRDYFYKSGFNKACLGLSGGIDSAIVACIAAEALGKENVLALNMPSRYSSEGSVTDSIQLSENLGIAYKDIPIEGPFVSFLGLLEPQFEGRPHDTTEENLQARIRGIILMAFSNKFGYIVLSTGNKSETAMGYATLYGDMCGGLGVISDMTKVQVYRLAKWINRNEEIIPEAIITKPPSAELSPGQKDSDSLPDYAVVDNVLTSYVVNHHSEEQIANQFGYDLQLVKDLVRRIHANEYKRRQSPPGLRVSERSFNLGRRFPIVQKWV